MTMITDNLPAPATLPQRGIQMTDTALKHVLMLRTQQGTDLCLRVGVRNGGCSGMSYLMDFETPSNIRPDDEVYDYDGFQVVCDPKSLLYLYGLVLDYSTALIGGGFQFTNPNASQTCGCGNSFSA
jgi:iron-sulfur cluster assembly protein